MTDKYEQPTTPEISPGILIPDFTNRFRVRFSNPNKDMAHFLTSNVTKCNIDYVEKILSINIQQPASQPAMHDIVADMTESANNINVESIAGDGNTNYRIILLSCVCIKHDYLLDYSISEVAAHKLEFRYNGIGTKDHSEL